MRFLVIDNYDSFTYNLVYLLRACLRPEDTLAVYRNDALPLEAIAEYDKILLSPGPGIPEEAGLLKAIIARYAPEKSILGVCLGLQAIGEVFGGTLRQLQQVYHAIATPIHQIVQDEPIFNTLPTTFEAGRYHSWVVDRASFPSDLEITAQDVAGEVMALRHRQFDVSAVQFHPESVLTPLGKTMIQNWVQK